MENRYDPTSTNHELVLLGQAPDDADDLGADREELFGGNNTQEARIDLGDGAGAEQPAAADTPSPSPASTGCAVRKRRCTSDVWDDMDKIFAIEGGREGLCCPYQYWNGPDKCKRMHAPGQQRQSVLSYNPDGTVQMWEFSAEVARIELCRLIARLDLPLCFGESDVFEDYIKTAHNPRHANVSRQTTTRDMDKYFKEKHAKILEKLKSASCVALTSDIWNGNAKEVYLSVVAHFVNSDWQLEKRIRAMRLIDVSHSGVNISERINAVVQEYALTDKVFSITLDNASANTKQWTHFHLCCLRCACHIINLMVKAALDVLNPYLDDFRTAISFLNSSTQRIAAYKSYCVAMNVRPRKFGLDMEVRWNSTYLMLKHLLPHKETFEVFIQTHHPNRDLLTRAHWYVAERILEFLERFYDSTVVMSGVYYPTSSLMLHHIIHMHRHMSMYENDNLLRPAVVEMKDKFLKYWSEIPLLYSFAFILDPRAKLRGFHNVLHLLSNLTGKNFSEYSTSMRASMTDLFNKYDNKFGAVRTQRPPTSTPGDGKSKYAWDLVFGAGLDSTGASSMGLGTGIAGFGASSMGLGAGPVGFGASSMGLGGSTAGSSNPALFRRTSANSLLHAVSNPPNVGSELSSYLDSDNVQKFDDDFNLLDWWHDHKLTYPVLSILAKDVLSVPVSTISSEAAFSLAGRVIEQRRRRLAPSMVEMLSLLKDWEAADARLQHTAEDRSLEDAFKEMYLDDAT
ncbi:hypothetical protein U9M48_036529 [Paspalum notatum var. saurae]|uniref:Transposase n=1 Tax=Paspalum notatum var. saurae TaxID=547442 RepID=A0AAQ3XA71_PASNO